MAETPTLPDNETENDQAQTNKSANVSRGSSPYDSPTKPGRINYNPSSTKTPGYNSGGTSTSKSKPSSSISGMGSSPTRDYRPRFTRQPSSDQSLSTSPTSSSTQPSEPAVPPSNEVKNEADDRESMALDRQEPVYDQPDVDGDDTEQRPTIGNPAKNPAAGRVDKKAQPVPSRGELASGEKSPEDRNGGKAEAAETAKLGRGYVGNTNKPKDIGKHGESIFRKILKNRARRMALGLPIGGGLVALIFVLFISLAPLKILHIVTNLENRFYGNANHAMDKESGKLLEGYVRKRLIVLGTCKNVVDIECNATNSLNPVTRLWKGWAHRRLEEKMANKYGFELTAKEGKYFVKLRGMKGDGADVGDFVTGKKSLDEAIANSAEGEAIHVSRNDVRLLVRTMLKDGTLYDKTVFKYKYLQLLSEKYGIRLCLFWCSGKDALTDSVVDQSRAAGLALSERLNRASTIRSLANCFFNLTGSCANTDKPQFHPCQEGVDCEAGGQAVTDVELELASQLRADAAGFGLGKDEISQLDEGLKAAETGADASGLDGTAQAEAAQLEAELEGKGGSGAFKETLSKVGWVLMAAQIIDIGDHAGPAVKKMAFLANMALAVRLFNTYESAAHECKSNHCNSRELGSLSDKLSYNPQAKQGGPASAEEAPAYNKYIGGGKASGNTKDIKCSGGKSLLSSGICPEEVFSGGIAALDALRAVLEAPGFSVISQIAHAINKGFTKIVGGIFSIVGGILGPLMSTAQSTIDTFCIKVGGFYIPSPVLPYCEIHDLIGQAIPYLTKAFTAMLPSPFGVFMGGARTLDMLVAGAGASGYDVAHAMGGVADPSGAITRANILEQQQAMLADYQSQPLLKRMFDTQSDYSPVTKLAMAMPGSVTEASFDLSNMFANPFAGLKHSFASLFSKSVSADSVGDGREFGLMPYVIPDQAIDAMGDQQDVLWDQKCSDNPVVQNGKAAQDYAALAATNINPDTGEAENPYINDASKFYGVNPCAVMDYAICPNSVFNDDMVCSTDDQNGNANQTTTISTGSTGGSTGGSSTPAPITGDCKDGGQYAAIVGKGASFAGVDQGIDFVPADASGFSICAPASGTIVQADSSGHHFDRTSGQTAVIEKLDQNPSAPGSSQYVYFIELIQIAPGIQVGGHVNKGDVIGFNNQSPGIEVGWANGSGGPGAGLQPLCGLGGQTACGSSFDNWVKAGGG